MSTDDMELWTIKQAADNIGLSIDAVYRAVRRGAIIPETRYGVLLVKATDARAYKKGKGGSRPGSGRKKKVEEGGTDA